jgi:hypothetical protein
MLFFAAENFHLMADPKAEEAMARMMLAEFKSYPRLVSFAFKKEAEAVYRLKSLSDIADRVIVMCDSGAYSVFTRGVQIKLTDYIAYLKDNEDVIDYAINLDVIGDGASSYENYQAMRSEGLRPIPVWHLGTEKEYLLAYLDETDFVGISLRKNTDPKKQIPELDDLWLYYLTNQDGFPKTKFHLFGVASLPVISRYPWWSFDSTSWVESAKFGGIYLPKALNGIPSFNKIPSSVPVSDRSRDKNGHLMNLNQSMRKFMNGRITSGALRFRHNHDLDDPITRYAINMAHFYKVAAIQPAWRWRFTREQIRHG